MLQLYNLVVETTRRCNMRCVHCLRGAPQPLTMSREILRQFLSNNISDISSVTFTGGEPSLPSGLRAINWFIDACQMRDITVGSFYIATNGKVFRQEFIDTVKRLFRFCDDNEISSVEFSNDNYHDEHSNKLYYKLTELAEREEKYFGNCKYPTKFVVSRRQEMINVLNEGRAHGWGHSDVKVYMPQWEERTHTLYVGEGEVYLNCKGNVIGCCDLSYKNQDRPKYIICKAGDFNEETIKQKLRRL